MSKFEEILIGKQKPFGQFESRVQGGFQMQTHDMMDSSLMLNESDTAEAASMSISSTSDKLSQDTGYGSSSMLIADVTLPQLQFDCEEFEQIVSTTPMSPQQAHDFEQSSPYHDSFDMSSIPHMVKKRKPRKQTHEPRRQGSNEDCEFIEITFPVTPDSEKKREKAVSKARRNLGLSDFDMGDVCAPYEVLCTTATPQTQTNCKGQEPDAQFDLTYPGIAPSQRTPKKIEARRLSIKEKISKGGRDLLFTVEEEFDIHDRAEAYVMSIMPDTAFYQPPSPGDTENKENRNTLTCVKDPYYRHQYIMSPYKRRRRRNYSSVPCLFVKRKTSELRNEPYDNSHVLAEGTKLMKPPNKLVELVAQTLDESPDGLLQVQQVYTALMNKYPYFRFMDRTSINSWRSSIRHALYQKWFRKVKFNNDLINCKGCFWAINRKFTPREWTMPGQTNSPTKETVTRRLPMTVRRHEPEQNMDENATAVQSILACDSEAGDSSQHAEGTFYEGYTSTGYPYCAGYRRCSDPVLANGATLGYDQQEQEYSQVKMESPEAHLPVTSWEQPVESSNMYLGTWTPSWEEYHQSLAFQPPLMAANYYIPQQYMEGMHYGEATPYYYHPSEHGYPYTDHW